MRFLLLLLLTIQAKAGLFECPKDIPIAANDRSDFFNWYDDHYQHRKNLDNFREETYGGRAQTYNMMKDWMEDHKLEVFGKELKDGDVIFEAACGEGFNLLITVEVLKEKLGLNVSASGIDYVPQSIDIANQVFDKVAPENKGTLCWGDATNLSYVPSNTFDIAYTGAIDIITDPLHLWEDLESSDEQCYKSAQYCDPDNELLWAVAQREQKLQEEWHDAWVKELIRIAKPGALIVIEDIARSICTAKDNELDEGWGGVDPEWWYEAPYIYDWGISVNSITEHESWYGNRYIISFRKLKEGEEREPQPPKPPKPEEPEEDEEDYEEEDYDEDDYDEEEEDEAADEL